MLTLKFLVLACFLSGALADYPCLCANAVRTSIYDQPDRSSNVIGDMYMFGCKPVYRVDSKPDGWQTVAIEHKIGYVENATTVEVQVCQGSIPDEDKVTPIRTRAPLITTEATTTQNQKTSTKSTAEPSTKPTTTQTSTTIITTISTKETRTTTATTTANPSTTSAATTTTTKQSTTTTTATTTPRPTTTTTTTTTTLTTTQKPTTTQYVPSCPPSVIRSKPSYVFKHRSFCYEFRESLADWYQARADCQQNGGFLLTIQSQDEQNFVQSMLSINLRKLNPVWLGLYDEAHEENWQWVSGLLLKYDNWMPGRYHDKYHSFENCGLYATARMGQWDDVKCRGELFSVPAKHQWICQYRVQNSQATRTLE